MLVRTLDCAWDTEAIVAWMDVIAKVDRARGRDDAPSVPPVGTPGGPHVAAVTPKLAEQARPDVGEH
jgi:hypothetical protein